MRYPASETAEKHTRILDQAARLFRERGFSGVSVSEIMKATGLTHGPFYNHFASKEALFSESIEHASTKVLARLTAVQQSPEQMAEYIRHYLSGDHRNAPGEGCLLPALGSEISREPMAQAAFTAHLKGMVASLSAYFSKSSKRSARGDSIRMLSSLAGAVMLARAVDDEAFSEEILREVLSGFK